VKQVMKKMTNGIAVDYITARLSGSLRSSCNVSVQNCLMEFKYTLCNRVAHGFNSARSYHFEIRGKLKFKHLWFPAQRDSRSISRPRDANVNLTSFTPDLAGRPTDSFRDWHSRPARGKHNLCLWVNRCCI